MSVDRRKFLKLAGIGTVLGVTGKAATDALGRSAPDPGDYKQPKTGKRWGLVIDLRKWSHEDSHAVREVCDQIHNIPHVVDEDGNVDSKREVKWIWDEEFAHAFPEAEETEFLAEKLKHMEIPVMCNHCDNPPCTRVCPTQATWKRKADGVVMMDWHRCIGCRFCIAACPYGSRSFNWFDPRQYIHGGDQSKWNLDYPTRNVGVVEKCTLCEERLAKGEQPACVEACHAGAMVFGDLADPQSDIRKVLKDNFAIRRKPGLGTQPEVYYIV